MYAPRLRAFVHVLWINRRADLAGGAERYVYETVELLRAEGVRSTLLYGVEGWADPEVTKRFDGAFPLVDLPRQAAQIGADVAYLHQLDDARTVIRDLAVSRIPAVRFFHDHSLFCLREHKYTTVGAKTCTRTVGAGCYPCLGFVNRDPKSRRVRLRTVGQLRAEQHDHQSLAGAVVGSRYMREHVVAHGFDPRRVHEAPLFVREANLTERVARAPREALFVGALLFGKGLDVLIDAMRLLARDVTLRVIGEGPQRALFEARATERAVADRIRFEGSLRGAALDEAYARAACLVVPSRAPETFALVGPEALVRGTPVVATRVGGVGEWLEDRVTGLSVPPNDPAALARAIDHVLSDPSLARALAAAGRARCLERLTPARHIAVLGRVLEAARRRA